MADINITINGRNFAIYCEDGQEQRVLDLGHYVDSRLKDVAKSGASNNESHLLVLTALMLADEVLETREELGRAERVIHNSNANQGNEAALAQSINKITDRVERVAQRIQSA